MTYPKTFNQTQRIALADLIPKLEGLRPGKSLLFSSKTPQASSSIRSLIYAWLSPEHSGLKESFRLKRVSSTELLVKRLREPEATVEELAPKEHPLLSEFIGIKQEDELIYALNKRGLSPKDIIEIHKQWTEVHK